MGANVLNRSYVYLLKCFGYSRLFRFALVYCLLRLWVYFPASILVSRDGREKQYLNEVTLSHIRSSVRKKSRHIAGRDVR